MFGSYRSASVWSAPEILKQPRKLLDPTSEMDVYSFGMLMWEVLHDTVPFDGDLKICTEYVVNSESRPKIDEEDNRSPTEFVERGKATVSEKMADLIRTCWQTHPGDRPKMEEVCQRLVDELWQTVNTSHSLFEEQDVAPKPRHEESYYSAEEP